MCRCQGVRCKGVRVPLHGSASPVEAVVVGEKVDRPNLEHLAQLHHRLARRHFGAVLHHRVSRPQPSVVLEHPVGRTKRARASEQGQRQQRRGQLEQPRRVGDGEGGPAAEGGHPRVWKGDHPVLHLEGEAGEGGHIGCGGEDDANSLHPADGGEGEMLPLIVRAVEGGVLVEDGEGGLLARR